MNQKFTVDEWRIVEEGFDPATNRLAESIFTLGNEHMGLRGFFEETYSGDSLPGIYLAGIYYPDKTRVGWWKIGYPEFFAKVINSPNWIGIDFWVDGIQLDLAYSKIINFRRELNMKLGKLTRSFTWIMEDGRETDFRFERFLSMADPDIAVISVMITPRNYKAKIQVKTYLDGDVKNEDANYDEQFWEEVGSAPKPEGLLVMRTLKSGFTVAEAMKTEFYRGQTLLKLERKLQRTSKKVVFEYQVPVNPGEPVNLIKYIAVCTSRDIAEAELERVTLFKLEQAVQSGVDALWAAHCREMERMWAESDVVIEGDPKAQQGIRYNIFQLNQTYTGKDSRLNIGPKGFSGEKYGGGTYWDTEAFCFPFYLYTKPEVAKNLLYYRYLHLEQAKENAAKLGLKGALYPMVTIDGRECHNEWEITFEEIHRNAAIAYAIYNYTNYTGDLSYLYTYGVEVLIEISRFLASRVTWQPVKNVYMILGVTGPNEYENNVNNNWYTNTMATWTLQYTRDVLDNLRLAESKRYQQIIAKTGLDPAELAKWHDIVEKMYYPYVKELGIFEQNDLYMDKEQKRVDELPKEDLPLNKHWSWDRILRSNFIKQADVIQGIYHLPERFDVETMRRNFDFYEPRTVHESSLSACIHSIVASWIGYHEKAYELYLRTARLDLDNYNDDTDEGIHLTSMAGTWSAIVQGFAGTMVREGRLHLKPYLPDQWKGYSFKINFRGCKLYIQVSQSGTVVEQLTGEPLRFMVFNHEYQLRAGDKVEIPHEK